MNDWIPSGSRDLLSVDLFLAPLGFPIQMQRWSYNEGYKCSAVCNVEG